MSEPIVPFRETIVETPKIDMVNEEIENQINSTEKENQDKTIVMYSSNKQSIIKIKAVPLPQEVTSILENNSDIVKLLDSQFYNSGKQTHVKSVALEDDFIKLDVHDITIEGEIKENKNESDDKMVITDHTLKAIENLRSQLEAAFKHAGSEWHNATEEIWSAGPRKCGTNLLLNRIKDFKKSLFDYDIEIIDCVKDSRNDYTNSFINGFQLATLAGPLCEEPMMGVAFVVEDWVILKEQDEVGAPSQPYGPLSGKNLTYVLFVL